MCLIKTLHYNINLEAPQKITIPEDLQEPEESEQLAVKQRPPRFSVYSNKLNNK